ncbi:hypothetical protein [Candidatus Acidianus copahuensis]|uniref:hypothetical protein n=1 Tax=Acidianus TaxID=12914 RepID=UPI0009DFC005|nr:hypothetical protein [Acidianus sp. RZ1]
MVVRYTCKKCGFELYRFEKVGQDFYGVRTPSEIRSIYGGRCPKCGHAIETPTLSEIGVTLRKGAKTTLMA